MNKPKKVREIFAELQRVYAEEIPATELLECASLIADASDGSIMSGVKTGFNGRSPFSELPVNEVIENWGWRVVCQEYAVEDDFDVNVPLEELLDQAIRMAA